MVASQVEEEQTDVADDHMLQFTRNLLRIGINHISYMRGLFDEKYFSEKSVLSPEMNNEEFMPANHDLGRLIDWMEKGIYDALQKKYLKTLLFCIRDKEEGPMSEEYAFSFSYPETHPEEIAIVISRTGSKKGSIIFKPKASELTPEKIKRYGCKMIRALVSLMKTVEPKPTIEERTVLVKLLFYDDVTPEDYEPPYTQNEAMNIWNKTALKMEVGNVNSKHLVLALKVKGFMNPSDDESAERRWDEIRVDNDFDIDGDISDTQFEGRAFGYVLCTSHKKFGFMLDSGATHHICRDKTIMRNLRKVEEKDQVFMYSANGEEVSAESMGCIDLKDFSLNPVGLIPSMKFNVVSVGQLTKQGLMICCGSAKFSIYDVTEGKVVGEGFLDNIKNQYRFNTLKWTPEAEKLVEISENATHKMNDVQEQQAWIIDTGCAQHLVYDVALLTNARSDKRPLGTAKGTIWTSHKGRFKAGKLVLDEVLRCGSVKQNLISGPLLDKAGYRITFCGKTCTLVHKDGLELRGVATQNESNNVFYLKLEEEEGEDTRESDSQFGEMKKRPKGGDFSRQVKRSRTRQ